MKKITPFFVALLLFVFANTASAQGIVINEILTSNTTVNTDEDGSYQDWVELYNSSAVSVNLNGYGLTDDATLPYKWTFPAVTMAPGTYLLIWCSDKNRTVVGQPLHTNWKISSGGETITLTNAGGTTVDSVPATALLSNISFGRLPNGTGPFVMFGTVTPNAVNASVGFSEALAPPTFSNPGGFMTAGISLTISTTVPGATIIYTLDGSEPSETNFAGTSYQYKNSYPEDPGQAFGPFLSKSYQTLQYSAPISIVDRTSQPNNLASISSTYDFTPTYIPEFNIFKGTVVRAKAIKPGALSSQTVTKNYYVSPQGTSRYSLPVVSLSIGQNVLFDYNDGIYTAGVDFDNWRTAHPTDPTQDQGLEDIANYYRRGAENERRANLSYMVNGVEVMNQDIGVRIHGGSSRDFPNKSFNLYSRSEFGDGDMSYQIFSDRPYDNYSRLVLRNSGNDFSQTMFRDALNQELMREMDHVITKADQPAITFINGEYWGLLRLNEKIDDKYFERVFNIPGDQVDVLESDAVVEEGDDVNYLALTDYLSANNLSVDANYQYVTTQLDPESFRDYEISNIFLQNHDWPDNNIVYWRKKTAAYIPDAPYGHDGRWRWVAHDMDDTYAISTENICLNSLQMATDPNSTEAPNEAWSTLILRKMLQNPGFKNDFINRFADLMNTAFLTSRVLGKIDEMKAQIAAEMPEVFARWEAPLDDDDWNYFIDVEKDFANQRPACQRNHIRSKFGIASNINATLDVDDVAHGYIKMNTIDIKQGTPGITAANPYPWTGIYFSGIPVTVKAIANPGFVFSNWTGSVNSTDAEITTTQTGAFNLTAHFVPAVVFNPEPIYFWMMNSAIPNDTPLESLATTFEAEGVDGVIQYQSCLVGYPFTAADPNWRTASMERRNSPTPINYIPEANGNIVYSAGIMKGLQITEPLENNGLGNTMVFNFSTAGYKDIKFSFAAINELTNATGIVVDYSVNAGAPVWITTGLAATSLPLSAAYQLFEVDFTSITAANDNANFKVRLRFEGTNMTVSAGNRITFNNIAVIGTQTTLAVKQQVASKFTVYPNPFSDILNIDGINGAAYKIFSIDGKLVKNGKVETTHLNLADLSKGMYLLQLTSDGNTETKKIIKK